AIWYARGLRIGHRSGGPGHALAGKRQSAGGEGGAGWGSREVYQCATGAGVSWNSFRGAAGRRSALASAAAPRALERRARLLALQASLHAGTHLRGHDLSGSRPKRGLPLLERLYAGEGRPRQETACHVLDSWRRLSSWVRVRAAAQWRFP